MTNKKYSTLEIVLKTLIFLFLLYALKMGVHRWIYYRSGQPESLLFYLCGFLPAAGYLCVFIALLRRKSKVFFILGMLFLALYEWQYTLAEHMFDRDFIHLVYMAGYLFLFLLAILLNFKKDGVTASGIKWLLPFVAVLGIVAIIYRIRFLQYAGEILLGNSHNIEPGGLWTDYEHLIRETSIILMALWTFQSHLKEEGEGAKPNQFYVLGIIPAVLFFVFVKWGSRDYYDLDYYAYMLGYLAIFILNIAGWIEKEKNFKHWLYLLLPLAIYNRIW